MTVQTTTRIRWVSDSVVQPDLDPAVLLERSAAGDLEAFGRFYDLVAPRVYGLVLRILRDPGYSEETVQEVFLQAWQQAGSYNRALGSVTSWILTIAHRRAVDRVRTENSSSRREEARAREVPVAVMDVSEEVVASLSQADEARGVRRCLEDLTVNQRESIELAYFSGLTYREVAERLDAALPTVKSRIRDGLRRLKQCLGGERR